MTTWHIITGEYPPAQGGVSDYTEAVAAGLASAGDEVHVWCPSAAGIRATVPGVEVHDIAGSWNRRDLDGIDAALAHMPGNKRLLVQWVPHAYGRRSLNVAFCRWIRRRARAGDVVDLMVHEPCLPFREGSLVQDAAAAVHRVMLALLLGHARRVWIAIPAWAELLRPWAFGRSDMRFCWLPVPSNIPVETATDEVVRRRSELLGGGEGIVLGHFGTYPASSRVVLRQLLPPLFAVVPGLHVQLLGRGSEEAIEDLRPALGPHDARVRASGGVSAATLSCHLQSCDLLLQPYPDGASTRRGTLMAALAHGLPVVTTIGRLSEPFWSLSGSVAAVPAGDLPEMARTVSTLARQPERRRQMASAARATYEARFSLARLIDTLRTDACVAN